MNSEDNSNETQISIYIFSVSAALVGVCLTVIGIFRAVGELRSFITIGDNILAIDSLIFLGSCIFAYSLLRSRKSSKKHRLEKIADVLFICGISLMTIVCAIVAYTFI